MEPNRATGIGPATSEPLGLSVRGGEASEDLRVRDFEFTSRGDRVPGRLILPGEAHPRPPVVLLQCAEPCGGGGSAPLPWARAGAALAAIDLPLHGRRASAKLTSLLLRGLSFHEPAPPVACELAAAFGRQAVVDLGRALDALERMPELDAGRVVYAGFGVGATLGAIFCAVDPRPRAAALALGGGGAGPREVDPVGFVGGCAPRPLLFVGATHDEVVPRRAADALFAAAREPKRQLWFDTGRRGLPARAFEEMWDFLRPHLGL